MNKFSKLFENNETTWEEDLIELSDIFLELEEQKICRIDYQAGYRTSKGSISYTCFLKDDKIEGDINSVNYMIRVNSKPLLRATLCEIKYKNGKPFSTNAPSFFSEDADIFISLMKFIDGVKKRMPKYRINITIDSNVIYVDFLRK